MEKHEKFILWCDKAMAFSFYALIYFLPISIALSETFTALALIWYLLKRATIFLVDLKGKDLSWLSLSFSKNPILFFLKRFKPIDNHLNIPVTLFLVVSFISAVLSQRSSVSWSGFLGKTLQSAFIYFNFIECINSKKRLKIFLSVFFVSCTLVCINGIYQSIMGKGFIFGHEHIDRVRSSFRHANDFGAYLIIVIPVLLGAVLTFVGDRYGREKESFGKPLITGRDTVLCVALLIVSLTCLGLTYSRGAWMGFLFAVLFFSAFKRKFIFVECVIIILFFSIFYPRLIQGRAVNFLQDSVKKTVKIEAEVLPIALNPDQAGEGNRKSFFEINRNKIIKIFNNVGGSGRKRYWQEAISMIKDYPVFGVGINAYSLVAPRYKGNSDGWRGWGGYPHNSYLQMTAEIGFVGITAFLWILFVLFRDSLRALRQIDTQANKILFFGFLTGLLGFLIHSFFDTNFYSVQLGSLLWIIMGVIIAFQKIRFD